MSYKYGGNDRGSGRREREYNGGGFSHHQRPSGQSYGRGERASNQSTHKPKLEEDYRNKNIHKFKRLKGSNVLSPRTERMMAQQSKHFKSGQNVPNFEGGVPPL